MLFLVHYDRKQNKVLSLKEYQDEERAIAYQDRLSMEKLYSRANDTQEIVLLEAVSKEQLRQTHPKYVPSTASEKIFLGAAIVGVLALLTS
jgi:hypothetical protein